MGKVHPKYPLTFSPLTIGKGKEKITFKHRIMMSPGSSFTPEVDVHGTITIPGIEQYEKYARGGIASVCCDFLVPYDLSSGEKLPYDMPRFFAMDDYKKTFSDWHAFQYVCKAYDCRTGFQMGNLGYGGVANEGESCLTPSPLPIADMPGKFTTEMTEDDIYGFVERWGRHAAYAKKGGFDFVQIIGFNGCFITNWLSGLYNKRTDEYGGSMENRCRVPIMIAKAMRKSIGDMPIEMKMNCYDGDDMIGHPDALTPAQVAEQIQILEPYFDIFTVDASNRNTNEGRPSIYPLHFYPEAPHAWALKEIRKILGSNFKTPIGLSGKVSDPAVIEQLLEEGTITHCHSVRQTIADFEWVKKVKEGREKDVRPCLYCAHCIDSRRNPYTEAMTVADNSSHVLKCAVNPLWGNGAFRKIIPEPIKLEKVAIVGGGLAGMQAALRASERGHTVTVYEKTDKLGGVLNVFADKHKLGERLIRFRDYLIREIEKTNVVVMYNTIATPEMLEAAGYDSVILAIGGKQNTLDLPGADGANVSNVLDVFGNEDKYGKKVVFIGGGMSACDAAIYLGDAGHESTLLEMDKYIGKTPNVAERVYTLRLLRNLNTVMRTFVTATEITDKGVWAINEKGEKEFFEADNVVISAGIHPDEEELSKYFYCAENVVRAGDCNGKEAMVHNAISSGYDTASTIGLK